MPHGENFVLDQNPVFTYICMYSLSYICLMKTEFNLEKRPT